MIFVVSAGLVILILLEILFFNRLLNSIAKLFKPVKRKIITALVFFFNIYPAAYILIYAYSAAAGSKLKFPQGFLIDYLIIYPFWIFFVLIIQFSILYALFLLLKLPFRALYKKAEAKYGNVSQKFIIGVAAFFALYVPARVIYDYNAIHVSEIRFVDAKLSGELNGFKILLISDLQADRYTDEKRLGKFIDKANELKPDLILIAGDMITGSPNYIQTSAKIASRLNSEYGVYSCVGDHDNWAYRSDTRRSLREIKSAFAKVGIPILDDANIFIPVGSSKIMITALSNTYVKRAEEAIIDSLTKSAEADLKIFLTHQPRESLMRKAADANYDMYLSGHTHGGPLTFFFPFYNLSPTLLETKYVRGYFQFDGMLVYVSRGLGMSIAPLRYNSTPEITIITLSKE